MPSSNSRVSQTLALSSMPAGLRAFLSSGRRRILVTRTPEDDCDSAFRAAVLARGSEPDSEDFPGGFVGAVGMALAGSGRRVLIVQAGAGRPGRRGLFELLHDAYLRDLAHDPGVAPGLGDWLETLDAQGRSGELHVRDREESFAASIVHGSIRAIAWPCAGGEEQLAPAALHAQVSGRVVRMMNSSRAAIQFVESAMLPADADLPGGAARCMDGLLRGRLPSPFLKQRIAEHLTHTALPHLHLLGAGAGDSFTPALRRPLAKLLDRLGSDFDVVLIDAPPVARTGPAAALATLADAVLVVASGAGVRSAGLLYAVAELRRAGARQVAVHAVRTWSTLTPAQTR